MPQPCGWLLLGANASPADPACFKSSSGRPTVLHRYSWTDNKNIFLKLNGERPARGMAAQSEQAEFQTEPLYTGWELSTRQERSCKRLLNSQDIQRQAALPSTQ